MEANPFEEVIKNITQKNGGNPELFNQRFDPLAVTSKKNKDGEELFVFRHIDLEKDLGCGNYSNSAEYGIYTKDGTGVGYISVSFPITNKAIRAEIQYMANPECRRKGNIAIGLEEVLKDIFVNKAFDGYLMKTTVPPIKVEQVFLDIAKDNVASQAVARKSGFEKNARCYEMSKTDFLIRLRTEEYSEKLSRFDPAIVTKAIQVLKDRRSKIKQNSQDEMEDEEVLEPEVKEVFDLMSEYAETVRQTFLESGETLTHITNIPPENMVEGKIKRAVNRPNHYETARGNWVFASSEPVDGRNAYVARNPNKEMYSIGPEIFIFQGDDMIIEDGRFEEKVVTLKQPNYIYRLNPERFRPVVTLEEDDKGKPVFSFSKEWISDDEIDLSDSKQVLDIAKVSDITKVVKTYQVLCDINETGVAMEIKNCQSRDEAIKKLLESIRSGHLRYINRRSRY